MEQKFDTQNAIRHLQNKWGNKPCPMCAHNNWTVSDKLFELREFQAGNIVLGAVPIIPVFPVTCNNCGNTVLVNGIVSQVVEPKKNETQ